MGLRRGHRPVRRQRFLVGYGALGQPLLMGYVALGQPLLVGYGALLRGDRSLGVVVLRVLGGG
ncbi:hypothetical protein STSP_49710 [Streptomyces jeddahensis]|uniref:Uncharacterized protein n=1 Tax=Streptomyces jeddahensis TaxID=1716141 RepID=A0A177HLA7_9ACTN|nr:hypothetical protein STSP_49710 [Streptomyces jeddahensis]